MSGRDAIVPGMIIMVEGKIYQVETSIKVSISKAHPFIKAQLKELVSGDLIEKKFKVNETVNEVSLINHRLEFLYMEGKDYLFLNLETLDQMLVSAALLGEKVGYLKEGVCIEAMCYNSIVCSAELPPFLELMVLNTGDAGTSSALSNETKAAFLETGAQVRVPLFVEAGDIIKIDTHTGEYVQRV